MVEHFWHFDLESSEFVAYRMNGNAAEYKKVVAAQGDERHGWARETSVPVDEVGAVQVGQGHVEEDQLRRVVLGDGESSERGVSAADRVALVVQNIPEQLGDLLLVVHDQDVGHDGGASYRRS